MKLVSIRNKISEGILEDKSLLLSFKDCRKNNNKATNKSKIKRCCNIFETNERTKAKSKDALTFLDAFQIVQITHIMN